MFKNIFHKENKKNITKFLIPIAIVAGALIIAQGLYQINGNRIPGALPKDKAAQKAIDFINTVALQGQATASLEEASEESGLYKIKLKIQDNEYESYVTKDAKLLFAQGTKISGQETSDNSSESQSFPKSDKPDVKLFVMSFCPYGNQAEELLMPVVQLLGDKANIQLHYVIYSNYQGGGSTYCLDKENKYCSMHGIGEIHQDVRELCVQKYQADKFWDFVKAINAGCAASNVDSCWENIAKNAGLNVNQIKTCQKNEALTLLAQETELNKTYSISGSPQLIINGTEYQETTRSSEAYKNAICSAFNSAPDKCSETLSGDAGSASGGCQ